jgi:DNA-binding transcriptional LysR family regulator
MRELRQFVEVASRRSISRAAEHLNMSQPALSRAIRKLEESYGAPLFVRNGAGVELSACGLALYSRAVRVLPTLDEAREEIGHLQGRTMATLHIASGDMWGLVILPEIIKAFTRSHANVVVHIDITDDGTRFEGLRNGVYDLVFGTLSYKYEAVMRIEFEALLRQATYVYCDRDHPLAATPGASLDDLLAQRWISPGYDDDTGPGPLARHARNFAVHADTMMHALLLMRNSRMVMAASSGFVSLFEQFGIARIALEDAGRVQESGAIYPAQALEKPLVRDFLRTTRERVPTLKLPRWPAD